MNDPGAGTNEGSAVKAALGRNWAFVAVGLAVLVYGTGYLLWYLGTPLGRDPQLDGRENLELAVQIAHGTLPHEPFYRAMLYPATLALPVWLGWPTDWLPALAAAGGLLCHFAATVAVALLAGRVWRGRKGAAALAAALWGLNPVALFYAVDVLDVTPAMALFLWGLVSLMYAERWMTLASGGLLGLAVAMRPHFLPVVLVAPLAGAWLAGRWKPKVPDTLAWAGAAVPLLLVGLIQWSWAGEFRIMPWQGAYNLYAANRRGANGKYYAQRIFFADIATGENPTRKESEVLFGRETGTAPPYKVSAMEGYWQARAIEAIESDPAAWGKLMERKAYYLFNNFDQYNNKTYAWHQEQSPWLWWNPLCWGILLVLAAGVLPRAWSSGVHEQKTGLAGLLLVFAGYGAGVMIYYASGRFRLPLAPLLCVMAGGWMGLDLRVKSLSRRRQMGVALATLVMVAMAYGVSLTHYFEANDESTFIQDELLSANAAAELGEDAQAYAFAKEALARDAHRPDARRIALISWFNLAVVGSGGADSAKNWRKQLPLLDGLELHDPALYLVAGIAWWKTGDSPKAESTWKDGAARFGPESAPARALATAEYLQMAAVPGSAAPPETGLREYLARPN